MAVRRRPTPASVANTTSASPAVQQWPGPALVVVNNGYVHRIDGGAEPPSLHEVVLSHMEGKSSHVNTVVHSTITYHPEPPERS